MGILYRYARTSAQAVECRVPVADRFTGRRGALVGRGAWSEGETAVGRLVLRGCELGWLSQRPACHALGF